MPRPQRKRKICAKPYYNSFIPNGVETNEIVVLTIDEYEVIRLIDLEKLTQEQCASQMDISRTTVTEIYDSVREKIADSIVNGKQILIDGGNYRICDGSSFNCCHKNCIKLRCIDNNQNMQQKGVNNMKIAATYENGEVFQHFGHTEHFKIYNVENGVISSSEVVDINGSGHGALASFLSSKNIDALICGGIGGGAQSALKNNGIVFYGGVSGNADEAVKAFIDNSLTYDPEVHCNHHEHGEHSCGENKNGCKGN